MLDVNYIIEKAKIEKNMKVADLGCGASGHFIFPIAEIVGKKGRVYAVDILKTVLENINRKIKLENIDNLEAVWSDMEIFGATKIESGSLDVTLLINTLYQSEKRAAIIREGVRMLKRGGLMMIVEWRDSASPFGPPLEKQVKIDPLKKAVQKLGLEIEEEFNAGRYHYGLNLIKI